MASKKVTRKSKDDPKASKASKAPKAPKAPKARKAPKPPKAAKSAKALKAAETPIALADDIRDAGFLVVLDPELGDRLDTLVALEVIARAGFSAPKPGEAPRKKGELTDARKSALKTIAEQLKREIKYVRKFL